MIKKKFSQIFLKNNLIVYKIINIILKNNIKNKNCILEIGPGLGIISKKIIKLYKKFLLIEIDKKLVKYIKKKFLKKKNKKKILNKNILNCKLKKLGFKKYFLIGNLPYNISSKIILWIINNRKYIKKCIFMLQKEFVDSLICKKGKKKTKLSFYLQFFFKIKKLFNINKKNFNPIPKVNSSLIKIKFFNKNIKLLKKNKIKKKKFFNFIKKCFLYKRKIIKNNLIKYFNFKKIKIYKNNLFLKRAEELSNKNFIKIYKFFFKKK
ncbi:MAG: 16S rRNA (adenine(1518)-N(6)/adenine(1519)-N(6))-dimethyltransferase RsmA [Candidatus Shikimatogenerans bostrichidophilus]|nr:MAG: 16S rRNA (adenine(1518)-N(6)/adenine(1519)-N(6))-dimethyltransferase RsmA [Candidatus Shikimatogenerans bostrichidophilus]